LTVQSTTPAVRLTWCVLATTCRRLLSTSSTSVSLITVYCAGCHRYDAELCADELVVGGGVGWSYDRRRRGFIVGGGGVGGVRPDERALKQRTRWTGVISATSPVISAGPLASKSYL